jgi:hypothetical protein
MRIHKLVFLFVILVLLIFNRGIVASEIVSPGLNVQDMKGVEQARSMLDSWSGQRDILSKAKNILDG